MAASASEWSFIVPANCSWASLSTHWRSPPHFCPDGNFPYHKRSLASPSVLGCLGFFVGRLVISLSTSNHSTLGGVFGLSTHWLVLVFPEEKQSGQPHGEGVAGGAQFLKAADSLGRTAALARCFRPSASLRQKARGAVIQLEFGGPTDDDQRENAADDSAIAR